jgi:hypothetical protein
MSSEISENDQQGIQGLEAAEAAFDCVSFNDIMELRYLKAPSPAVQMVTEAVMSCFSKVNNWKAFLRACN